MQNVIQFHIFLFHVFKHWDVQYIYMKCNPVFFVCFFWRGLFCEKAHVDNGTVPCFLTVRKTKAEWPSEGRCAAGGQNS